MLPKKSTFLNVFQEIHEKSLHKKIIFVHCRDRVPQKRPMSEFNELKPRLKSPQNRFQLSAGLNLEKINYNFKWNRPYLSPGLNLIRGSNSLNSASGWDICMMQTGMK